MPRELLPGFQQAFQFWQNQQVFQSTSGPLGPDETVEVKRQNLAAKCR